MNIEDLLIDFDEMGFAPMTICPNPDEYAYEWKMKLVAEINRQQAEIERLKAHINEVADKVEDKMTYMSGCQNLIQTVKKIILGDETPFESLCDNCGLCKEREEEAVKEFAYRLKDYVEECKRNGYDGIGSHDIDDILKEMVGDTE